MLTYAEAMDIFQDSSDVPRPDDLYLGWTKYSYDPLVYVRSKSDVSTNNDACNIPNTIAPRDVCPDDVPGMIAFHLHIIYDTISSSIVLLLSIPYHVIWETAY